jgi:prophage antirepressor-like protein
MIASLTPFTYNESNDVRVVIYNGNPWFVAKDVTEILGINNPADFVRELDEDEKGIANIDTLGGKQNLCIVSEAGLYSLVFKSRKPEAKEFKRWITHEVLPSVRQTGSYSIQPKSQVEALLESVQLLAAQEKRLAQLEDKTAIINHRIDNLDLTNIEGTPRQRLVKMVQRYANQSGITYSAAWHEFTSAYNTAYRTNLKARINRYSSKMSTPEYLDGVGEIEDAIRVADKMLNPESCQ